MGKLIKTGEAADRCGVTPRTLRNWCLDGDGPPHIVLPSGHHRFDEEKLEEWLEDRATSPDDVTEDAS